jgi:MFS family permease
LVTFVDALLKGVQDSLTPYVTSSFSQHGLLATTSILSTVLGGVCNLTIAKVIDIWGRCEGFVAMVFLVGVGMIMKAVCKNVETYAAAEVFYWVGQTGMNYIISVIVADISTLQNRLILFGINGTPTIATTFTGPRIAQLFYDHSNFRWAFGAFLIILVAFCIPVGVVFLLSKRKTVRLGVYPERDRSKTWWEATEYYVVQFDGESLTP